MRIRVEAVGLLRVPEPPDAGRHRNAEMIRALGIIKGYYDYGMFQAIQIASIVALRHTDAAVEAQSKIYEGRRDVLVEGLRRLGFDVGPELFFDTLRVRTAGNQADPIFARAAEGGINLRAYEDGSIGLSLDEVSTEQEVRALLELFVGHTHLPFEITDLARSVEPGYPKPLARTTAYLTHGIFNRYHAEHEMLRYLHRLQGKDLSLTHSMIPLGS